MRLYQIGANVSDHFSIDKTRYTYYYLKLKLTEPILFLTALKNSPSLARILPADASAANFSVVRVLSATTTQDPSTPPIPNLHTHPLSPTGPIITEIDDRDAEPDFTQNGIDTRAKMTRNNSLTNRMSRFARQLSLNSKNNDSPSLPKRNQPNTSSAPSTLTKKNLEPDDKKEVYV